MLLMGAVVLLPTQVPRAEFDSFMWAYVIELLLTSLLNLGLERLVATDTALGDRSRLPALFTARIASLPLAVFGVWGLLALVHEPIGLAGEGILVAWVASVQVQGVLLAALRGAGRSHIEPVLLGVTRAVQALALLGSASQGARLAVLLSVVAIPDLLLAVGLVTVVRPGFELVGPVRLPWRVLGAYTGIEILAFAYLRADAVVVGNVLGSSPGATYSLAYRVLDGLTAMLAPFILYLFPAVARLQGDLKARERLRRLVLGWAPAAAMPVALIVMYAVPTMAHFVRRLGDARAALEILLITLPLYCFSAFELHFRSAEGRNRSPLVLGALLLLANVVLNLLVVPQFGIIAAAWVLVGCEGAQAVWLGRLLWRSSLVDRAALTVGAAGVVVLALTAGLLAGGHVVFSLLPAGACVTATGFLAAAQWRQRPPLSAAEPV